MNASFRQWVLIRTGLKCKAVQASGPCAKFAALSLFALAAVGGCSHHSAPAESPTSSPTIQAPSDAAAVPESGQEQFQTPQDAAAALKKAVDAGDRRQLIQIFGNDGRQLVLSGDRVQEVNDMQAFASRMAENMRVELPSTDKAVLYIGAHNWPFPIPIVKSGDKWFFDTVAGKDELLNRRIGENELQRDRCLPGLCVGPEGIRKQAARRRYRPVRNALHKLGRKERRTVLARRSRRAPQPNGSARRRGA